MQINRLFTQAGTDPYAGLTFVKRESVIRDKSGKVIHDLSVMAPESWGQTAVDMLAQKYLRKAGVPDWTAPVDEAGVPNWLRRRESFAEVVAGTIGPVEGIVKCGLHGREWDGRQVFDRIAGAWTYWGWKFGYFKNPEAKRDYRAIVDPSGLSVGPELDAYEDAEENARAFFDEVRYMLANQTMAPNSPQWFNAGLHWAYGIEGGDEGRWAIDVEHLLNAPDAADPLVQVPHSFVRPQVGACYILSLEDTLLGPDGIMDFVTREARIFKGGSGSGANYSNLRGANEPLSGGGKSSGLPSFLKPIDAFAGSIKSGGTNRRAARMVVLDLDHPDIEWFVDWKVKEENKVAALVVGANLVKRHVEAVYKAAAEHGRESVQCRAAVAAAAVDKVPYNVVRDAALAAEHGETCPAFETFDTEYEGEAYQTVSGQNANNSVRVTNEFMKAVKSNADWHLYHRTEKVKANKENRPPKPCKTVKARDLWRKVANAAWECADPGTQFHDVVNDWNTCLNDGEIKGSNPCCLVGETLVDTSEGLIRIDRLVEMSTSGQTLPYAFSYDVDAGRPTLSRINRGWVAGHTKKLVRVTTDKGVEVTCTPEHRFLTYSGGYVRADRLTAGASIRKISRHANKRRSGRVMITDPKCGNANGTEYQSLWMWEQVNGPVPKGHEVHHRNGDPTDDRLGNFEVVEKTKHRSQHAAGATNNRFIEVPVALLVRVYDQMTSGGNVAYRDRFTVGRWNRAVRELGLLGQVPLGRADKEKGSVIQGVSWAEFTSRVLSARESANDRVVKVEVIVLDAEIPVYDIEVDGTNNFAITNSDVKGRHTIVVHNSEFMHLDNTTCNLACLNFVALCLGAADWKEKVARVRHAARLATIGLDVTVSMSSYPSRPVAEGAYKYRTIGLGYANLGAYLMREGFAYDSVEGRALAAALAGLVHYQASITSSEMASELGAFPRYADNKVHTDKVVYNHSQVLTDGKYLDLGVEPPKWVTESVRLLDPVLQMALRDSAVESHVKCSRFGLRNAQLTLCMPAGTVGLLMACDTTGVEPDFSLVKGKTLSGGGYIRIVNQSVDPALERLGYSPEKRKEINAYILTHGTVEGCGALKEEHLPVFDCAVPCPPVGKRSISVDGHLLMMAAIQPLVSGSISKCVTGDTILATDRGLKRIASLHNGNAPDTFVDIDIGVPTSAGMSRARHFYYGGKQPVWRVTLGDGRSIRGTAPHRLRVATPDGLGWREVPNLKAGDYVALRRGTECWGPEAVPEVVLPAAAGRGQHSVRVPGSDQAVDVARFLGMLTADGHVVTSNYTVGLTKNEDAVRVEFMRLLHTLFGLEGREIVDARNGVKGVTIGSKSLVEWLAAVGFSKERMPDFVLGGSRAMAVAYLSGLYLDGYFTTTPAAGPIVSQRYATLLDDVAAVWDNLGVATYRTANTVDGTDYPVLHVYAHCRERAAGLLTWMERHKAAAAATVVDGQDRRVFPMKRHLLERAVRSARKTQVFRSIFDPRTEHIRVETFAAVAREVGLEITREECDLDYVRVEKVEYAGEEEVYDLSVPGPQEFVGNGVVNHNTLNLPGDASVDDVEAVNTRTWELAIKCSALYRDGSKLSQPLNAESSTVPAPGEEAPERPTPQTVNAAPRRSLPGRRNGYTQKFRVGGHKFYLNTGEYADGTLGEIFLTSHKDGALMRSVLNALAQAVSIGLQYGVPLKEYVDAYVFTQFEPNGPVSGHDRLKNCTSPLDALFRDLAISYLGRDDLAHVAAPEQSAAAPAKPIPPAPPPASPRYEGVPCAVCGMLRMVRDGKCLRCDNCGCTTGCS